MTFKTTFADKLSGLRAKTTAKIDYLKTLGWNLFAPNLYKHLVQRYSELMGALDERDEEYDTDINLADEENRRLKAENQKLMAENAELLRRLTKITEVLSGEGAEE